MKTIAVCVLGCLLSGQVTALNESEPSTLPILNQSPHTADEIVPREINDTAEQSITNQHNTREAVNELPEVMAEPAEVQTSLPIDVQATGHSDPAIHAEQLDTNSEHTTEGPIPPALEEPETRFWLLDWSQEMASDYVEKLNDGVDSFFMGAFFDDEVIEDESSGSNGRLYFTTRRVAEQGVDYKVGLNLSLVLPKTRDRFKLLVETDDNNDGQAETDLLNTTGNVTYTTAIRIELNDGKRWKNSLDNGVRWEGQPVYFTRLRNRRTDYFYNWRNRFLHSIYWRTDIEWGTKISSNLLHPITDTSHFSTGFNADYIVNNDYADLDANVAVFHQINRKSAMLYQLAVFGDTDRLTQINNYVFSVSYRRKIYRQFVFAEIVPEVAWPREDNFEATPALNFRLEMIFGTHYN